jgi:starvation-inducible DNA-binding protein
MCAPQIADPLETPKEMIMSYELTVQDGHPTLRHAERESIGAGLQGMLVDLVDLSLIGKQLHWNVTGPHFRSLHLQLDELVDSWRQLADEVAERAVALGIAPDGRATTVASDSVIESPNAGPLADDEVIAYLTDRLIEAVTQARERMEHAAEYDRVTEDLLIEVVDKLEQQQWMIRAQQR